MLKFFNDYFLDYGSHPSQSPIIIICLYPVIDNFQSIYSRTRLVRTHFSEPEFIYYINFNVISTRLVVADSTYLRIVLFPLPGGVRTNRVLLYL